MGRGLKKTRKTTVLEIIGGYEMLRMQKNTAIILLVLFAQQAIAQNQEPPEQNFIRVTRDRAKTPISLDTAIVRYEKGTDKEKVTIDLIGAVHVGDRSYYANLNRIFKNYNSLCYELVAAKGQRPQPSRGGLHPHDLMGMFLELEAQVAAINYTADNFVHADMSPKEIAAKMDERGDNVMTLVLSGLADMIRAQNLAAKKSGEAPPQIDIGFEDLFNPIKLKRSMVGSFEGNIEKALGPTAGQYLIIDRNKAAMKVVDLQIQLGLKKIGVFYGAGHMQDFHEQLYKRGFKLTTVSWEKAWDLSGGNTTPEEQQMKQLIRMMQILEKLQRSQ